MAQVIVTSSADADVYAIQSDLAKAAGIHIAAKYTALFEKLYDRLAEHPDSGAPRPGLGKDIRIGIVLPYIVIYRHHQAEDVVTVLRVVHGRRNITAKLISD
jgi:plasmid stabilization system protein ParE